MVAREGRSNDQLRPVRIIPHFVDYPEGSALIEMGRTRVLCAVSVEESVPPFLRGRGQGWLTSEYSLLPRSTHTRTPREVAAGRPSGRTVEIQRLIGRSLRAAVDLDRLGERTFYVDCDVLQADGGTRTAAITGAYVALVLALRELQNRRHYAQPPLLSPIAAVSVGIVDGEARLDLEYEEDRQASVDFNVVMTGKGEYVEVQGTAEGQPFGHSMLLSLLDLARQGAEHLFRLQNEVLGA